MRVRIAAYGRYSTGEQSKGVSMELQESKIRAYCQLNDLELVEMIKDEGISGKETKNREGFKRLMELIDSKAVDGIVIYRLDRLFRNTLEALQYSNRFEKLGVALHSVLEQLNTATAVGKFYFTLISSLAELESNTTSERVRATHKIKKAKGERYGYIPFGYTVAEDGKQLIEDATEQKALRLIKRLRRQGHSYQDIATELNEKGYRTRKGNDFKKQNIFSVLNKAA